MHPPRTWTPPVARAQAGLFTAAQARAAGLTVEQVRHRRRTGLWMPVAGAALAHRDRVPDLAADAWAIALTWPDAVTCLASAARLHGLPVPAAAPVTAWVPHGRRARRGIVPVEHRMPTEHVQRAGGTAVTSPARTVFDCLGRFDDAAATDLLVWALTRRVVGHSTLARMLAEAPGLDGNPRRRRLLHLTRDGAMSVAEHRLHAGLRRSGIDGWVAGAAVHDAAGLIGLADVLFPAVRLVLEVDGLAYHGAARFQADRTRQNRLVAAGYTVLRFTWGDVTDRPGQVVRTVQETLARLARAVGHGRGPVT